MSKATRDFQWNKDPKDTRSLLQVALDVHMTKTGSSERPDADQRSDIELLWLAVNTWEPSPDFSRAFDEAVKDLIDVVLDECG